MADKFRTKAKKRVRNGITAVLFRLKNKIPEFLVLHRVKRWTGWELLKGGRKGKENPITTLKRELREEIGAKDQKFICRIPFTMKFKIPKKHVAEIGFTSVEFLAYLVRCEGNIDITKNEVLEHSNYKWLPFDKALKILTYTSSKTELKIAYSFMKKKKII